MSNPRRFALIALTLLFGISIDHVTKIAARFYLASSPPLSYWGDVFRLQYTENHGAFLGLGVILPTTVRFWIFTVMVTCLLLAIFVYLMRHPDASGRLAVALTLILTGGVSNLIDRFINDGGVIDFMNMGIGGLRTRIFNVADMIIMAGLGLVIFSRHGSRDTRE
jgi:signal peptidase II